MPQGWNRQVKRHRTAFLLGLLLVLGLVIGLAYSYLGREDVVSTVVTTLTKLPEGSQKTSTGVDSGPFEGMNAPDFSVKTIDGRRLQLSELRGRPVVLWFMAAWCPSCKSVASILKSVTAGRDVHVIVVDMWTEDVLRMVGLLDRTRPETSEDLLSFNGDFGGDGWNLVMDDYGLTGLYQLRYVDSMFVIDEEGVVVLRSYGPVSPTALRQALSK